MKQKFLVVGKESVPAESVSGIAQMCIGDESEKVHRDWSKM